MDILIKLAYNGSGYAGWQNQKNALSVQETLENALRKLYGVQVATTGAGRTDSGVHALAMPVSMFLPSNNIPFDKLPKAINSLLPYDIRVLSVVEVEKGFNARFDAKRRSYLYKLTTKRDVFGIDTKGYTFYDIDFDGLVRASKIFLGSYDFTTFSKNNPDTKNTLCNIEISSLEKISDNEYHYRVKADRFIYGMVRSLVGAMIDVGRGHRSETELKKALLAKDRKLNSPLAPASGLYFVGAEY